MASARIIKPIALIVVKRLGDAQAHQIAGFVPTVVDVNIVVMVDHVVFVRVEIEEPKDQRTLILRLNPNQEKPPRKLIN